MYSQDKRFIGYIIKEEGKPLMGQALWYNIAGLMVPLVIPVRLSSASVAGGPFYDELSTNDSEKYEDSEVGGCGL